MSNTNVKRMQILGEIDQERDKQEKKWGPQNYTPPEWVMILVEEVGEVSKAALEHHFKYLRAEDLKEYRKELVQVAAVACAMIESVDRNELKPRYDDGPRFHELAEG